MKTCDCGNLVEDDELWDLGVSIPILKKMNLKCCKKCWLNDFSNKRVAIIKEYIESLKIKYTPPTFNIVKTITGEKEFEIGQYYLVGEKTINYYAGFYRKDHWFVPLDLSYGYIVDNFNNFENDCQPNIPKEYLPPKELMDFVCSRPSLHLLPELVRMTMSMKKKAYQLVELTSNWSNDFGDALQTGTPKPFTFKEKTLMEELEITEADLKNKSVAASVKDLENWNKEDTYKEAINITKQLIKLYLERGF